MDVSERERATFRALLRYIRCGNRRTTAVRPRRTGNGQPASSPPERPKTIDLGQVLVTAACLGLIAPGMVVADDWLRFRGPNGTGISQNAEIPLHWSSSENLRWKTPLPGYGSSSPIVVGQRVFVTCFSGPGVSAKRETRLDALRRHLVCIDRDTGKILWTKSVDAEMPEDEFGGYLTEHGYASNTPTSDGERVFVFFGKSRVLAFDLEGKTLWTAHVGKESSTRRWGSAASPILYKNALIVNASEESNSIRALDKLTGRELWKIEANMLELAYGTPALVTPKSGPVELVLAVPGEVWALDPERRGKLLWRAETRLGGNVCPSPLVDGETVYVFGGVRSSGSHALRAGGHGDVTRSHMLWTSRNSSYVATPVLVDRHLYWIDDRGQAWCVDATNGSLTYRERVSGLQTEGRPVYASPILVGDKLVVLTRWDGTLVLAAKPKFEILARNQFNGDDTDFNATPAVSGGDLFLKSNLALYCISSKKP